MSGSPAFSGLVCVRINPLVGGSLVQRPLLQDRKVLGERSPDLSLHLGPIVRRHIVLRHEVGRSRRLPSGSSLSRTCGAARHREYLAKPDAAQRSVRHPGRLRAGSLLSFLCIRLVRLQRVLAQAILCTRVPDLPRPGDDLHEAASFALAAEQLGSLRTGVFLFVC